MSVAAVASEALGAIRSRGTYRRMRVIEGAQGTRVRVDGRDVLLFAGSNYLDLAHHPAVVEASARAAREFGCAAGGSRLIIGNHALHERLEEELADFLGTECALVFGTGYMVNVGAIPALVGRHDVVVSDALAHASIIDGCRLSQAGVRVFAHSDAAALECVLREETRPGRRILVAVEAIGIGQNALQYAWTLSVQVPVSAVAAAVAWINRDQVYPSPSSLLPIQ